VSASASAVVCTVKFVNLFAGRQPCLTLRQNRLTSTRIFFHIPRISSKSVQYSCEAKEIVMARDWRRDGQKTGRTRQKHNARCNIGCGGVKTPQTDAVNSDHLELGVPDHKLFDELHEIVSDLAYVGRQQRQVLHVAVSGTHWTVNEQNVCLFHLHTHMHAPAIPVQLYRYRMC